MHAVNSTHSFFTFLHIRQYYIGVHALITDFVIYCSLMNRIDRITDKITLRYVVISFIVAALFLVGLLFYGRYFSAVANGYPYLENSFFYSPADLIEMAQGYGAEGRRLYIRTSTTLDLIFPLLYSNFLTAFAIYLLKKAEMDKALASHLLRLGIGCCLSDWLENLCMILLLSSYPDTKYVYAFLGRIMTSVKYLLLISFILIVGAMAYKALEKRSQQAEDQT